MFDRAKDFIINRSTFLDVSSISKFFAQKVVIVNSPQVQPQSGWPAVIAEQYYILKMGDVNVIARDFDENRRYNDAEVEISGQKRAARIYLGKKGKSRLIKEVKLLHKLSLNPRVTHAYGVFKSHDAVGLVYKHDGTLQKAEDVMRYMTPLQQAAFHITFFVEYFETYQYLRKKIGIEESSSRAFSPETITTLLTNGVVTFNVDSTGRLRASLSERPFKTADEMFFSFWPVGLPVLSVEDFPNRDLEIFHSIKNSEDTIDKSRAMELIPIAHTAFLWMARHHTFERHNQYPTEWVFGVPVFFAKDSDFDVRFRHISGAARIDVSNLVLQYSRERPWKLPEKISNSMQDMEGSGYIRFEIPNASTEEIFDQTSLIFSADIRDRNYYHSWLYILPLLLKYASLLHHQLGIVSGVAVRIDIDLFFSSFIRYFENKTCGRIFLFISSCSIEPNTGRIMNPHIYWSFDESGAEPLTEQFLHSIGILGIHITMRPRVTYWDQAFYMALHNLYEICGMKPSDAFHRVKSYGFKVKQEYIPRSTSYLDDITVKFTRTEYQEAINEPWRSYPEPVYKPAAEFRDISSLSWIGITHLEDCEELKYRVYETIKLQNKRRRRYETREAEWEHKIEQQEMEWHEWDRITHSDAEYNSEGSDIEKIPCDSIVSLDD